MKRHILIVNAVMVLVAWLALGLGYAFAQGTFIYPVDDSKQNYPPIASSTVKLSILKMDGVTDITGDTNSYPIPEQPFLVKVIGATLSTIELVENATFLTTSKYPGICTNYGDPANQDLDFDISTQTSSNTFQLTPKDLGGRAVVKINGSLTFVIPQDSDFDGIPDIYEGKYCASGVTCLNPQDDIDTGPDNTSPAKDGISNFDEYRGFRVGEIYRRGNPFVKDVFVNFVEMPQCTDTAYETDGSNKLIQLNTFYTTGFTPLFSAMDKLMPGMVIHHINKEEWIDNFSKYTLANEVELNGDPAVDRQIDKNAILRPAVIVKGIRLVQCLDLSTSSPFGLTRSKQPPDISGEEFGTAIIFPQRIWYSFKRKFAGGAGRLVKLYDFNMTTGAWFQVKQYTQQPPTSTSSSNSAFLNCDGVTGVLRDAAFPFYAAHESTGHNLDLTPTVEGTTSQPSGYHHVEGTGTVIDKEIVQVIDKKTASNGGFNKFYIPSLFSVYDKRTMRLLQSQQVVLP